MLPYACELNAECVGTIVKFQFFMNSIRYFPIAGAVLFVMWIWKKDYFQVFRIQEAFPKTKRIWYEVRMSFITLLLFVGQATFMTVLGKMGITQVYLDFWKYGIWYHVFTLALLIVWHETWFYWFHRAVHVSKPLFKKIHLVHHRSTNPSPMAAYSFHPFEAYLEVFYLTVFVFVMPVHPVVILTQAGYAMIMNIWWHSGYEFMPSGWTRGRFTKWINTSTHHNMHHSHINCNYSLYFNFWDRLCGTNHPEYDEYFERVKAKRTAAGARDAAVVPEGAVGAGT